MRGASERERQRLPSGRQYPVAAMQRGRAQAGAASGALRVLRLHCTLCLRNIVNLILIVQQVVLGAMSWRPNRLHFHLVGSTALPFSLVSL
jgi:hypothetical protein